MNLTIIDTAIGLIFVFLLVSLICSAVREMIESVMKQRAVDLHRGIRELLFDSQGSDLARELYTHPLVYGLYAGDYERPRKNVLLRASGWMSERWDFYDRWRAILRGIVEVHFPTFRAQSRRIGNWFTRGGSLPSYIPTPIFARALADMWERGRVTSPAARRALELLAHEADGDAAAFRTKIELWYDSCMERVSGWYKRRTQGMLIAVGFVAALVLNIDTIEIADTLFHQSELRTAVVGNAETYLRTTGDSVPDVTGNTAREAYQHNMQQLQELAAAGLPMGWRDKSPPWYRPNKDRLFFWNVLGFSWWMNDVGGKVLLGWLMTALAVSLGAPFWFDLLSKFMSVRSTFKPKEEPASPKQEEKKEVVTATTSPPPRRLQAPTSAPVVPAGMETEELDQPAAPDDVSEALVAANYAPNEWGDTYKGEEGVL